MLLWLNPVSGVSGDMLLGALLDLGAPLDEIRAAVAATGMDGWTLEAEQVDRGGLRACHAVVRTTDDATERRAAELLDLVGRAPAGVRELAVATITRLAEVEAALHGVAVEDVHLHELGGVDTVVDVVGVAAALAALEVTAVSSAPVHLGSGTTASAHGRLPVPAPATLRLLAGAPVVGLADAGETVTPTGAALLVAAGVQWGPLPAMSVVGSGYGAGTRDPAGRPNVLPAVLGQAADAVAEARRESLLVLETTVDDVTAEELAHAVDAIRAAGARDAWTTAALGKKGRPAQVVSVLCEPGDRARLTDLLFRQVGTLGVRAIAVERDSLPRTIEVIEFEGERVQLKVGPHGEKPEHDDLARVAARTGEPVRLLAQRLRARRAATRTDAPPSG